MDNWDHDCDDFDDDKWDFGDTATKSEPTFHVQLPGTKRHDNKNRHSPWVQSEQPATSHNVPTKPPENAARQKRFQAAQDARRQCTAGSFSLATGPPANYQNMSPVQTDTRPVPTSHPEVYSQPSGCDPLTGLGRGAVEVRPAWFPGGRGRGIIDQPMNMMSRPCNEAISTMHVAPPGYLPRGMGRGRGRGYGAMAQPVNAPPSALVARGTSGMPEPTLCANKNVVRNVDEQFQSMSMHSIASGLLSDAPPDRTFAMSSQNSDNVRVDCDSRVLTNSRTDTSVGQCQVSKTNSGKSNPTQVVSEKQVDLEAIQHHNPDVSVSWMAKMMGVDQSGNVIPSAESVPLGSPEVDNDWLSGLERKWNANDRSSIGIVSGLVRDCFRSVVNPYVTVLNILENVKDFQSAKTTTLAFTIVREFERWSKEDKEQHKICLNRDVRVRALNIACRANMTYFDFMAKAYRLAHEGNDYFLPYIHSYLSKQKYKEASHCVTRLGLQDHFDIKDICLPLIFQDKVNMVEQYVSRRHNQQVALVQLLDHMVDANTDLLSIIQEANVPKLKHDKMTKKIIAKLAIRLMKLYKIPQEECPNISKERTMKGMRYLMYKRYIEKGIGYEQWVELVKGTVDESAALQLQLVDQLIDYLDMAEAAKWAKHYGLPNDKLPHQICHLVQTAGSLQGDTENDWDDETVDTLSAKYHELSLGLGAVHVVDTRQKFLEAVDHINLPGAMVGIDAEWKPTFGQTVVSRLALLQLATISDVFLFDVITLHRVLAEGDWKRLATDFFANPDILKLGYAVQGDLQMLVKSVPFLAEPMSKMQRVVDLPTLYSALFRACPDMFDGPADSVVGPPAEAADDTKVVKQEERGLSDLVKQCLGRPLNKQQQMSDWERRPLRQPQVVYAALDAFCLLEVYNTLTAKAHQRQLNVDLEPCLGYKSKPRKTKAERKQQRVAERPDTGSRVRPPPNPPARTGVATIPKDFRVVCDTMLQGLGRYLRVCGADVVILENNATHDEAAVIARNEDRIVMTSGAPFMMLRGQVPIGYCYNVGPGKARDQVVEVLEHYNVAVTPEDIFSRCQTCNSCDYLYITPEEMRKAWEKKTIEIGQSHKIGCKAQSTRVESDPSAIEVFELNEKDLVKPDTDKGDLSYEYDHLDLDTLKVGPNNVPLQVEAVPEGMLGKVDMFFVCAMCGKVFWQGGHFTKVRDQFAHVMKEDKDGKYLGNFIRGKAKLK